MMPPSLPRCDWHVVLVLTGLALSGRLAIVLARPGELTQDRDAYLGLAESLRTGRGLATPESDQPTAYRPPLYPLVLSLAPRAADGAWVAAVNVLSGMAAVGMTYLLAMGLGLPRLGVIVAAALVAIDPLLVRYASQPMTESLCTGLVAVWLWTMLRCQQGCTSRSAAWAGILFGLCVLSRPTLWASGVLIAAWGMWRCCRDDRPAAGDDTAAERTWDVAARITAGRFLAGALGCAVVVLPWVVRNQIVFGTPILTTTHGGYTLLLGNNPEFYAAIRRDPWAKDWDGPQAAGQALWQHFLQAVLHREGVSGEVETDAWMNAEARRHIRADLPGFLRAAGLRQLRLWNMVPLGDARTGWPVALLWGVGAFYAVLWVLAAVGACDVLATRAALWMPGGLVVLSFMAVHLGYWTNARMRAPLVPILALLAVRGGTRLWTRCIAPGATGSESSAAA